VGGHGKTGVFVAGVPSSLPPRTAFFSRVLAPLPFPRLRLLCRLEIHIFELQNEEINVKKILAVINATYAVAKRRKFFQAFFSQLHKLR